MNDRSVFVRVTHADDPARIEPGQTYLFEIEPNRYVPREICLDADGRPSYITRLGEYPISDYPAPPGSQEFEEQFGNGERITSAEFELAYLQADAILD